MWALVEDNEISKIINNPKAIVIGDVQYPAKIFQHWTEEELNNIGIYEVVNDWSNKKDEEYYTNTNQSFDYADGQVTASYGTATPKPIENILWTQADIDELEDGEERQVGDLKCHYPQFHQEMYLQD